MYYREYRKIQYFFFKMSINAYKKPLKVFFVIVVMWVVSMLTIIREYKFKRNRYASDEDLYAKALYGFRKKYAQSQLRNESPFIVWELLEQRRGNLTDEDKLAAIKGYEFPPGMNGRAVRLHSELKGRIRAIVDRGWKDHAFNQFVSDLIPASRSLPDPRHKWCRRKKNKNEEFLSQASVIICFYNEAWSTLLRTLHSVLLRSPDHLLKEIILFDDASTMSHLNQSLDNYVRKLPKVVLVRAEERQGLIRARVMATKHVSAPVVVFLDSHCECSIGWLEPLLSRIAQNPHAVVSPVVDNIHDNTFEYIAQQTDDLRIGGFTWELRFIWKTIPRQVIMQRKTVPPAAPLPTPTISGGLFAINLKYFEYLGFYDEGFEIWGAENLELSFKVWMCGGALEIIPCSHVGHVFRKRMPYKGHPDTFRRNSMRLALVWMDEYAKYFYQRIGNVSIIDYGDVSTRIDLRRKLNCKPFKWYLDNVYIDMEIPEQCVASGQIQTFSNYPMCLDGDTHRDSYQESIALLPCHYSGGNQFWMYTRNGEIRRDSYCLDYFMDVILMNTCSRAPTQVWLYNDEMMTIRHLQTKLCLRQVKTRTPEYKNDGYKLALDKCKADHYHQWSMENYNITNLKPELQIYLNSLLPKFQRILKAPPVNFVKKNL